MMSSTDKTAAIVSEMIDVLDRNGIFAPYLDVAQVTEALTAISIMAGGVLSCAGVKYPPEGVERLIDLFDAQVREVAHDSTESIRQLLAADAGNVH
jgi:DNA-binding GntR family transcriptional regulator